jgi:hypothetical protein
MAKVPPSGPTLTIREASRATGLSVKAVRGRVERGSLKAVMVDNRRRIPLGELVGAGLLLTEAPDAPSVRGSRGSRTDQGTPSGYPTAYLELILDRIDQLREELAKLERAVDGIRERAANVEADRETRRVLEARLEAALERIREVETARKRA